MGTRQERPRGFLGLLFGDQADYVRSLMPAYTIAFLIFFFSLAAGYSLGDFDIMDAYIDTLPSGIQDYTLVQFLMFIIGNNVFNGFLWIILGYVFSFPSLYLSALNGFVIGNISHTMILESSLSFVLVGLIPHGIVEIPTLLLCSAMGMGLGYSLINRLRGRGSLRLELVKAMRLFITRVLPLIVLAAVIEVTVSPFLMSLFGFY
jgi:stage II sporulation protein M